MECPWCGGQVGPKEKTCPNCGSRLRRDLTRCSYCGAELRRGLSLCSHCGREQRRRVPWRPALGALLGIMIFLIGFIIYLHPSLLPSLQLPSLTMPSFHLPSLTLPSFHPPSLTLPTFEAMAPPTATMAPLTPIPSTSTPTLTPRPPTHTPTPTSTNTPTPTSINTPTYTPTVQATSTTSPVPPSPTATPTLITSFKYPRPELREPADQAEFKGPNAQIVLKWSPMPTGALAEGEWYGVSVRFTGRDGKIYYRGDRLKEPQWLLPRKYYDLISLGERTVWWDVTVVREIINPDGSVGGIDISPISETRTFFWR